jgi:lipoprotein-anchoring transpeptidase ErfK/SrfK
MGVRPAVAAGTVLGAALLAALAACTSSVHGEVTQASPVAGDSSPTTPASVSTSAPPSSALIDVPTATQNVNPATPVSVSVTGGALTSVRLVTPDGNLVAGALATDGSSWTSTQPLGYGRTYQLTALATGDDGSTASKSEALTTLTPDNMTMPYLNTTGGDSLTNGATYGIGIVPVVHFDEPITDRAAAENALEVDTSPHVDGVWDWIDAQNVHWRPETFWAPGTKVTLTAHLYGLQVGPGLFGQSDVSVSFKIGAKHVSVANDKSHQVQVFFNDKLVRTMPTSMGQGGIVQGTNGPVSLWTMNGTYTVIGHENPAVMSSASFGIPANSSYGYAPLNVYEATRISTDGIYLHSAPWSVGEQGYSDVSHGCLNLSPDNATWFYNTSQIGDVVVVKNTGGATIQQWQNGDWSVPWSTWVKGSALHQ